MHFPSMTRVALLFPLLLLSSCVVWTRESATTGMGLRTEPGLAGTWATTGGDSAFIASRGGHGLYTVRIFAKDADFGGGTPYLTMNAEVLGLGDDLLMDLRIQGWAERFQVYLRVKEDSLWGWQLPPDSVRTWLQLHSSATPAVVEDPRDASDNKPRLILTGSSIELRRFLADARVNHKTWFPAVAPALRVKVKK
jgi:hypothetical protein